MSRPLRLNDKETDDIVNLLRSNLKKVLLHGQEKLNFSLPVPEDKAKAKLVFSSAAWSKMHWLVQMFDGEIQWHGLIARTGKRSFFVKDILTFPHEISPVSVISDQKEYTDWLLTLPPEQANELFFHGHSHVDMPVSPSGVDIKYRSDIIGNIGIPRPGTDEDIFYTFIILNKRGGLSAQIFDVTNNIVYDTADINLDVRCEDGTSLSDFITKTRTIVKKKQSEQKRPECRGYTFARETPRHDKTPKKEQEPKRK